MLYREVEQEIKRHSASLEQIKPKVEKWDDFKNNGGSIGGAIITNRVERVIPANTIEHGYGFGIGLKSANGLDKMELVLGNNGGKRALYSVQRFGLGTPDFAFSEIWVGNFSKQANGYTVLPNGFILQWGNFTTSFKDNNVGTAEQRTITLPIQYPNIFTSVQATVGANTATWDTAWTSTISTSAVVIGNGSFETETRVNVGIGSNYNFIITWMAIGY